MAYPKMLYLEGDLLLPDKMVADEAEETDARKVGYRLPGEPEQQPMKTRKRRNEQGCASSP